MAVVEVENALQSMGKVLREASGLAGIASTMLFSAW
jgi:hypothetical protein